MKKGENETLCEVSRCHTFLLLQLILLKCNQTGFYIQSPDGSPSSSVIRKDHLYFPHNNLPRQTVTRPNDLRSQRSECENLAFQTLCYLFNFPNFIKTHILGSLRRQLSHKSKCNQKNKERKCCVTSDRKGKSKFSALTDSLKIIFTFH